MASIIQRRISAGVRALGFVLMTLLTWWGIALFAGRIARCVPWGECRVPAQMSDEVEVIVLISSLLASLWIAQRLFFLSDEFEPAPEPRSAPAPLGEPAREGGVLEPAAEVR